MWTKWMVKFPSWETSQFLFVVFCACCAFWPYAAGYRITALERSPLRESLNEQLINREGSMFALALLVPLFFDWLADLFVQHMNPKKKDASDEMITHFEKAFLFVSLAAAPCLTFVSSDSESLALLWFCLTRFQVVAVLGTFRVSLSRYDSRVWSWWSTMLSVTIITVALNITTWTSMNPTSTSSIAIFATTLKAIALSMNFFQSGLFLLRQIYTFLYHGVKYGKATMLGGFSFTNKVEPSSGVPSVPQQRRNSQPLSSGAPNQDNSFMEKMFFPILFVSIELVSHFIVSMSFIVLGSASQFNPQNLLTYKVAFIVVEVGLLFYYMRKVKYESLYNLRALVESRKQYLRYIAHEMRTPLNSAVLGLKLICDSLATIEIKDDLDYELEETAGDVSKTIAIAVEILADLMTFNKIEGGLMKLHKQEINVKEYIQDVVDTVSAEAREKSISIVLKKGFGTFFAKIQDTSSVRKGLLSSKNLSVRVLSGVYNGLFNGPHHSAEAESFAVLKENDEFLDLIDEDTIFGDKFKMDQVLRNLLSNALKFSPRGSVVSIRAAFQPTKDTIKSYEPSIRDSVAYHIVDGITRHTSTFFGKMFQNIGNFNKSRKNGHVDDNVEVGVGAGTGTGVGADNNVISSPRQKPKEDLYQEGELVIMVTDLGAGISKENQEQLFQEGMQFNPEKLQTGGGSGFGLFISKSIVLLHGGTLKAYSAGEGKGCSFMYKIPMTRRKDVSENALPLPRAAFSGEVNVNDESGNNESTPNDNHRSGGDVKNDVKGNHVDIDIQPSLQMPCPVRARASLEQDEEWSNPSECLSVISQSSKGLMGMVEGAGKVSDMVPIVHSPPPLPESQCGGGAGGRASGFGGPYQSGNRNQGRGAGDGPRRGSGKNHDNHTPLPRDAAVNRDDNTSFVNRPTAANKSQSPGLASSHGSHDHEASRFSRKEMARKLSMARSRTLLVVSPPPTNSPSDHRSNPTSLYNGGHNGGGPYLNRSNRHKSSRRISDEALGWNPPPAGGGGTGRSNGHHHRPTVSEGHSDDPRPDSAEEERSPALVHVDDGLVPLRPLLQQPPVPDPLQEAVMNGPSSPPLTHIPSEDPTSVLSIDTKLPPIRESLSMASASRAAADSSPQESPHSSVRMSIQQSAKGSLNGSAKGSMNGSSVRSRSRSRSPAERKTSSNSANLLSLPLDGTRGVSVSGLISQNVVNNQFSHSSNSKTKLDSLVDGSTTGVTIGGGTLLNIGHDGGVLASPTAAVSRSPSGTRRGTRQLQEKPKAVTQSRLFHILVVDDSAMSRKMLMKTLKNIGHTCEEAEDGQIAVDKVKEKGLTTYDAILMDFVMPVLDGPDATKAIRDLGYIGPIIGCTGNTLDMDLLRFKESGCDRVIGKPFESDLFHQFMDVLAPPSSNSGIVTGTNSGNLTGRV